MDYGFQIPAGATITAVDCEFGSASNPKPKPTILSATPITPAECLNAQVPPEVINQVNKFLREKWRPTELVIGRSIHLDDVRHNKAIIALYCGAGWLVEEAEHQILRFKHPCR